jgi:uncharacterized protein (UPF0179 family)
MLYYSSKDLKEKCMLEKNTTITLDNGKKYSVLRTIEYNDKQYALITDFGGENNVIEVEKDDKGICVSLISNPKEEEIIINKFLKDSLEDLKNYKDNKGEQ